jgi:hypothetical protein
MSNKKKALQLLSQMIEISEGFDKENRAKDSSLRVGEGFYTFHLKLLLKLLTEDEDVNT